MDRVDTLALTGWAQAGRDEQAQLQQAIAMVRASANRVLGAGPERDLAAANER